MSSRHAVTLEYLSFVFIVLFDIYPQDAPSVAEPRIFVSRLSCPLEVPTVRRVAASCWGCSSAKPHRAAVHTKRERALAAILPTNPTPDGQAARELLRARRKEAPCREPTCALMFVDDITGDRRRPGFRLHAAYYNGAPSGHPCAPDKPPHSDCCSPSAHELTARLCHLSSVPSSRHPLISLSIAAAQSSDPRLRSPHHSLTAPRHPLDDGTISPIGVLTGQDVLRVLLGPVFRHS